MIQHTCGCGTTFWGKRNARACLHCREVHNRLMTQKRMQRLRRGESQSDRSHRPTDLTTEQIEAMLAAGDARIKAQRHQCARRTA